MCYRSLMKIRDFKKQSVCVKFCFKFGKTAKETHYMLKQAFGENAMGKTQTYDRPKRVEYQLNMTNV